MTVRVRLDAPNAAATCCEAMTPTKGKKYPCRNHHRGDLRMPGDRHPSCTRELMADDAGRPTLPVPTRVAVALRRVLHPQARGRELARDIEPGVARRNADRSVYVEVGRRHRRPGVLVDPRAGLPGVSHLASGPRIVSGVDNRVGLRAAVKAFRLEVVS